MTVQKSDGSSVIIRPVIPEQDVDRILEIYSYYILETAITYEYTVPTRQEFLNRMAHTLERYPYLVAEQEGRILGYAYAGTFNPRAAYDRDCEMTIYLDHEFCRRGLGKRLYLALEEELRKMGMLNFYACIGYPVEEDEYLTRNSAEFHAHLGYRLVGEFRRCGYKFGRWYNMVWMEKLMEEETEE